MPKTTVSTSKKSPFAAWVSKTFFEQNKGGNLMYNLLIKLMLIAALAELGFSLSQVEKCRSKECAMRIERASRDVLRVDWKPISVFPEEAKRFR